MMLKSFLFGMDMQRFDARGLRNCLTRRGRNIVLLSDGTGNSAAFDLHEMEGQHYWLAVDLSSNSDLTVIVACWRYGEDGYFVWPWSFCPKDNLQSRADRDGVAYPQWAVEEFITPTDRNIVDFRAVEACIRDLCNRFDVQEIAFDPHLARTTMNALLEDGLPAVEMRQG
jgi:phage terminase large subunit-like protein